jgi:hypothetical protein
VLGVTFQGAVTGKTKALRKYGVGETVDFVHIETFCSFSASARDREKTCKNIRHKIQR